MQQITDIVSLLMLACVLAASLRIVLRFGPARSMEEKILTHPAWFLSMLIFIPWTVAGFARGEISFLPWKAFTDHAENGVLDASAYFLCVLVVDLWMFVVPGQLAAALTDSTDLSAEDKFADRIFYTIANFLTGVLIVMQASNIYYIYQHVSVTTAYFVVGITALAIYFHARFTPAIIAKAPAILTTCGILGTFIGVAIGLMDFDPSAVQRSVPALIDGIKTAFWASACGIFFALTVKLREVFFGGRAIRAKQRATVDDLAAIMTQTREDSNARLDALTKVMETFVNQQRSLNDESGAHKISLASKN